MNEGKPIKAFLSCSIHERDKDIVKYIDKRILDPAGFKTFTIGRNESGIGYVPDVILAKLKRMECVIAIVTARSQERRLFSDISEIKLRCAPYIEQESSIAIALNKPFACFKASDTNLEGFPSFIVYIDFDSSDHIYSLTKQSEKINSYLNDLKQKVFDVRRKIIIEKEKDIGLKGLAALWGIKAVADAATYLQRPECFGTIDLRYKECQECPHTNKCKMKKFENIY